MIIEKIRAKNFFNIGNAFFEVDLLKYNRSVVFGKNGSGKSSIFNIIVFGLFGQTIKNVNRNQIVNSINGMGCLVEAELTTDSNERVLIRRGIKPNIFEIFINGVLQNQTSAVEYQDTLEKNIIKTTYRTFSQTAILSIENYKPFMSMRAYERRNFVEDILDIRIFTFMNQVCKQRMSHAKDELKIIDVQLKSAKQRAILQKKHIDRLDELVATGVAAIQNKIDNNETESINLNSELMNNKAKYNDVSNKHESISNELKLLYKLQKHNNLIEQNIVKLQSHIDHHRENSTCPTCNQDTSKTNIHADLLSEIELKKLEYDLNSKKLDHINELESKQTECSNMMSKINNTNSISISRIQQLLKENNSLKSEIMNMSNSDELNELKAELKIIAKEAIDLRNRQSEINESQSYYETMIELFKDTGIKSKIVSQYIPIINQTVNDILEKLDFFVSFNLDESFNEVIKSRHRDQFTYDSFSAGEKQRIDLALMFTFRHLAGIKNSLNCNLLCLDELLDSSLDSSGIDNLIKIFESPTMKDSNIFIISHRNRDLLEDIFDGAYEIYREQGFSMIRDMNESKA